MYIYIYKYVHIYIYIYLYIHKYFPTGFLYNIIEFLYEIFLRSGHVHELMCIYTH